mmetsp:Transcript_31175/g.41244  ORF Transcript_31175/g.41244 Transcript_31175/m.41244 type:complete len:257 (+) Transcript_31175:157-927(+)
MVSFLSFDSTDADVWLQVSQFLDFETITLSVAVTSKSLRKLTFDPRIWFARTLNILYHNDSRSLRQNFSTSDEILDLESRIKCKLRVDVKEAARVSSGCLSLSEWCDATSLIEYYQHQAMASLPLDVVGKYIRIGEVESEVTRDGKRSKMKEDVIMSTKSWNVFTLCEIGGEGIVSKLGPFESWLEKLGQQTTKIIQNKRAVPQRRHSTAVTVIVNTIGAIRTIYEALMTVPVEEFYFGVEQDDTHNINSHEIPVA